MFLQEIDFELTSESLIAYRGDDLYFRCKDFEDDIETYLVVAGSGTSVGYCACSDVLDMLEHFKSLEYSFRTYRERVCRVLEDVAVDKVLDTLAVISLYCIYVLV